MLTSRYSNIRPLPVALALAVLTVLPPAAASADLLGTFEDWEAHSRGSGKDKICYAASVPVKSEGKYSKRGDVFLLVSHRPAIKQIGIVSLEAGYAYGDKSQIAAKIGDQKFAMFPFGEVAFAFEDGPMVKGMIKGAGVVIKGTSSRGTLTTDDFSLKGFTAAYKAASKACGVKE